MTDHEQEHKQPKSVLWHSSNPSDFLKQNMGMIQANSLYNNEFLQASEVWKFTNQHQLNDLTRITNQNSKEKRG